MIQEPLYNKNQPFDFVFNFIILANNLFRRKLSLKHSACTLQEKKTYILLEFYTKAILWCHKINKNERRLTWK